MSQDPPAPLHSTTRHPRLQAEGVDVRITKTVLCANCGYNLKGLPYVSNCVECNSRYNARRAMSTSVYEPGALEFPFRDVITLIILVPVCLAFGYACYGFGWLVFLPFTVAVPIFTLASCLLLLVVLTHFVPGLSAYFKHRHWERLHAESIAEDAIARTPREPSSGAAPVSRPGESRELSPEIRERLASEGYKTELDWPAICVSCGYNLRFLPVYGRCPECGSEYEGRPMGMKGVMSPYGATISWSNVWGSAIFAVAAFLLAYSLLEEFYVTTLILFALSLGGSIGFAAIAWHKSRGYAYARRVLRQMEEEDEEEEF